MKRNRGYKGEKGKHMVVDLLTLLGYCNSSSASLDWEDSSPLANVYLSASVVTDIFIGYSG